MSNPGVDLILASASPARAKTLTGAGVRFGVRVSGVDEATLTARYPDAEPADLALILARAKAEAVAGSDDLPDQAVVVGCDSVLELDGRPFGKPSGPAEAIERIRRMRDRAGVLHTGHWVVDERLDGGTGATLGAVGSTLVRFAAMSDAEIEAYVATGEPLSVAGSFTVDGLGGPFIAGIEGDYHNVVGLSLPLLRDLLTEIGISWPQLWAAGVAQR